MRISRCITAALAPASAATAPAGTFTGMARAGHQVLDRFREGGQLGGVSGGAPVVEGPQRRSCSPSNAAGGTSRAPLGCDRCSTIVRTASTPPVPRRTRARRGRRRAGSSPAVNRPPPTLPASASRLGGCSALSCAQRTVSGTTSIGELRSRPAYWRITGTTGKPGSGRFHPMFSALHRVKS